jgi:hypothetical protein
MRTPPGWLAEHWIPKAADAVRRAAGGPVPGRVVRITRVIGRRGEWLKGRRGIRRRALWRGRGVPG